jgi:hypothetical protein
VNRENGAFSRVLGPFKGLSALPSPSGDLILYSFIEGRTLRLGFIDVAAGTSTFLPITTLVDKCAWSADGSSIYCGVPTNQSGALPDDWHQGVVSFNDRLWRIDLAARVATLILDPQESADVSIDMVGLAVDPARDAVVFSDKNTLALFAYDL